MIRYTSSSGGFSGDATITASVTARRVGLSRVHGCYEFLHRIGNGGCRSCSSDGIATDPDSALLEDADIELDLSATVQDNDTVRR